MRNIPLCRLLMIVALLLYAIINVQLVWWFQGPSQQCPPCPGCLVVTDTVHADTVPSGYKGIVNATGTPSFETRKRSHHLAVVVPFRNRWEELIEFVPHMYRFLVRQNVSHEIWIINQADKHRYRLPAWILESI